MEENNSKKKIAYLIQAYADSDALIELISILLNATECHIFVHLDKKSDLNKFWLEDFRVHFIKEREFVSWAGYKQGKLIFNLIDAALEYPEKFDRYCFLSESDFPVYSGNELVRKIEESNTILINCSEHQREKIERYWFYDFGIKSVKLNKVLSKSVNTFFKLLYIMRICKKKSKVMIDNNMVDVYCSGPFWSYDYEQIKYISMIYRNNKQFRQYFKYSFAPCELMVATIIGNSKYKNECVIVDKYINLNQISSLCFFKYTGPRVDVLTEDDYHEIIQSRKPFVRKIKKGMSDVLVAKLKENW